MVPRMARRGRPKRTAPPPDLGTDETRSRLKADPLFELLKGQDASLERAADEIRAVYTAIVREVMHKNSSVFALDAGKPNIPDDLAYAHAQRYIPWVNETGPHMVDLVLSIVMDRNDCPSGLEEPFRRRLHDYALRMRH